MTGISTIGALEQRHIAGLDGSTADQIGLMDALSHQARLTNGVVDLEYLTRSLYPLATVETDWDWQAVELGEAQITDASELSKAASLAHTLGNQALMPFLVADVYYESVVLCPEPNLQNIRLTAPQSEIDPKEPYRVFGFMDSFSRVIGKVVVTGFEKSILTTGQFRRIDIFDIWRPTQSLDLTISPEPVLTEIDAIHEQYKSDFGREAPSRTQIEEYIAELQELATSEIASEDS